MEENGRLEAGGDDEGFEFGDGKEGDVALPGLEHVGVLRGRDAGDLHQAEPDGLELGVFGRSAIAAQVGADEATAGMKPVGDVAEEAAAFCGCDDEVRNEQGRGGVKRCGGRQRVEVAGVKRAPPREAVLGGATLAERHHGSGGLDDGELPVRKMRSEGEQLVAGAGADAEKAGVGGEIRERGARDEKERIAERADLGEAIVVSGGVLFVETDRRFS